MARMESCENNWPAVSSNEHSYSCRNHQSPRWARSSARMQRGYVVNPAARCEIVDHEQRVGRRERGPFPRIRSRSPRKRQMGPDHAGPEVLLRQRGVLRLSAPGCARDVDGEVRPPEHGAPESAPERDGSLVVRHIEHAHAGPDRAAQVLARGRRRQEVLREGTREHHFDPVDRAGDPDGAPSVEVDLLTVDLPPAQVRVAGPARDLRPAQGLDRGPKMILRAEPRRDDGARPEGFPDPVHAPEVHRHHRHHPRGAAQGRLDLIGAPHLGAVVVGHLAHDLGGEVREHLRDVPVASPLHAPGPRVVGVVGRAHGYGISIVLRGRLRSWRSPALAMAVGVEGATDLPLALPRRVRDLVAQVLLFPGRRASRVEVREQEVERLLLPEGEVPHHRPRGARSRVHSCLLLDPYLAPDLGSFSVVSRRAQSS